MPLLLSGRGTLSHKIEYVFVRRLDISSEKTNVMYLFSYFCFKQFRREKSINNLVFSNSYKLIAEELIEPKGMSALQMFQQ